ncbi:MAG: hypothetical protein FGM18_09100 [Burkholderiaceae bacterium]|nr:hypothetical protein [Burkholderiaceae bacterium]
MVNNLIAALNWAISKDEPLHLALKSLSGKRLRVVFPIGGSVDWEIEADGLLKEVGLQTKYSAVNTAGIDEARRAPDVTLILNMDITKAVRIEGDAMAAERLGPLVKLLKERFSPWERFLAKSPAGRLTKQAAEYAVHEAGVLVGRQQAEQHHQALREFRDALDRLEKRIDVLSRV